MADKKITELSSLTSLAPEDLFVVVDDPSGTPITKKIAAADLFGNGISYVTTSTNKGATVLRSILTANVSANTSTANTLIAAEFITNATATSANSEYQYAILAKSALSANTANVTKEHATVKFILDVSNSESLIANTYVGVFKVSNTGVRVANVGAFIGFGDIANNTTAQTKYLFDVGLGGAANVSANVTTGTACGAVLFSNSAATAATHKVRIRVNGTDYWLLATDTAS
jgi:hypothetical protein